MTKRFVPIKDADKRAIRLHLMLDAIREKLSTVGVKIRSDDKAPIRLSDKNDPDHWGYFSVENVLNLDLDQAIANGGGYKALIESRRPPARPKLPQSEIDRAVDQFLSGRDDE